MTSSTKEEQELGAGSSGKVAAFGPTPAELAVTPPKMPRRKLLMILGIVALVVIVIIAVVVVVAVKKPAQKIIQKKLPVQATVIIPPFKDTYLAQAEQLNPAPNFFGDYGYFGYNCSGVAPDPTTNKVDQSSCPLIITKDSFKYYRIGTTSGGKPIIVAYGGTQGLGESGLYYIALQTGQKTYSILEKASNLTSESSLQLATFTKALDSNTILDTVTNLPDLELPINFKFKGTGFVASYQAPNGGDNGYPLEGQLSAIRGTSTSTPYPTALIGNSGPYSVYEVTEQSGDDFAIHEYYLTVKTQYAANYVLSGSSQFNVPGSVTGPSISWLDGTVTTSNYAPEQTGCGSVNGYVVATGVQASSLTVIGKAPDGSAIYQLPTNSTLFQKLYQNDYSSGAYLTNQSLANLTADQLQSKHAIFLTKNGLGELDVYLSQGIFVGGGCLR